MIHQLPEPIHGATHVRVDYINERPGANITIEGSLGTMEGEDFVLAEMLRPVVVDVARSELNQRVPDRVPDWRRADLTTILDSRGWRNDRQEESGEGEGEGEGE